MVNVCGDVMLKVCGKIYCFWFGMSVLVELQVEYGDDFLECMELLKDVLVNWMLLLNIVCDIFIVVL